MPNIGLGVELDTQQFQQVRAKLREAGEGGILRELDKAVRAAGDEVLRAEQSAARQLPAAGPVSTGLRASIAASAKVRVSDRGRNPGVRVYVAERGVRGGLGRATNLARGWRHPVYGNRSTWVRQVMSPGWWDRAAAKHADSARTKVVAAVVAAFEKIAG